MSINKMTFQASKDALDKHISDCLVVGAFEGKLTTTAEALDKTLNGQLIALVKSGDITGKAGDVFALHNVEAIKAKRLVIVGLGKEDKYNLDGLRKDRKSTRLNSSH